MKNETNQEASAGEGSGVLPATGNVTMLGLELYDLEGYFYVPTIMATEWVHLHSLRLGDSVNIAYSEVVGSFLLNPRDHVGACLYSLEEAEEVEGELILSIKTMKEEIIGSFVGIPNGEGVSILRNKKGHLHVHPSEHNNEVIFQAVNIALLTKAIKSISFELDQCIIPVGQIFDGVSFDDKSTHTMMIIDVKSSRKQDHDCAEFYKRFVAFDQKKMMHTEGGSAEPHALHFAITGKLIIDEYQFDICFGQGTHGANNYNWHLSSPSLVASADHKSGILGGIFAISTIGSHTFNISRV